MKPGRAFIDLLAGLACISGVLLYFAGIYAASGPAFKVRAIAHQWWWEFDYPSLGVRTSDVLYLPSNNDVELDLVSADVIHSFWIMGMKDPMDIIPGETRLLNLTVKSPGELYGNCDSGCGCGSVCMRFRVLVRTPLEFQAWAAGARLSRAEFKPPQRSITPDCALDTGRDGHAGHAPTNRLQQLLDESLLPSRVSR